MTGASFDLSLSPHTLNIMFSQKSNEAEQKVYTNRMSDGCLSQWILAATVTTKLSAICPITRHVNTPNMWTTNKFVEQSQSKSENRIYQFTNTECLKNIIEIVAFYDAIISLILLTQAFPHLDKELTMPQTCCKRVAMWARNCQNRRNKLWHLLVIVEDFNTRPL